MKKIRFGITGSGYMGRTHAEAIRKLEATAALVAIWGGSRAPGLAKRYGIDCEPTVETLMRRTDIDAIVITTPHHLHINEALLALESGKHVLVEKPMATTVEDCDRMLEAADRRRLVVALGYTARFRTNPPRARELIAANAIGRVLSMHFSYIHDLHGAGDFGGALSWLSLPESIGNVIDGLPHGIDLMRWFTGAEVKTVAGFCRTFLPGQSVEDTDVGIMEFSNGMICSMNTTCAAAGPYPGEKARLQIIGSTGSIDLDPFGDMHISDRKDGWRLVSTQAPVGWDDPDAAYKEPRMLAYYAQMQSFIDGIHGKPMQAGSGIDGREGVAACLALLTATREHRLVQLDGAPRQDLLPRPGSA